MLCVMVLRATSMPEYWQTTLVASADARDLVGGACPQFSHMKTF